MTEPVQKSRTAGFWERTGWFVVAGLLAVTLVPLAPAILGLARQAQLRGPDFALFLSQPAVLQWHVYAALTAFAIGTAILLQRKGSGLHKVLGWAWVAAMASAAVSSLFLTGLNGGFYSFIHLLSGWTLIALPMGIFAIRNKKVLAHRRAMTGVFVGGLLIAGVFAFIPGRLMWNIFFS